jgi:hypothetical protein
MSHEKFTFRSIVFSKELFLITAKTMAAGIKRDERDCSDDPRHLTRICLHWNQLIGNTLVTFASQIINNPAVAVLLTPIVLNTANYIGTFSAPLINGGRIFSFGSFLIRVGHSANIMVMS